MIMAGSQLKSAEDEEKPKTGLGTPKLEQAQILDRATKAFNLATGAIIKPLAADLTALRKTVLADQGKLKADASESQRNDALQASIESFTSKNPKSALAIYLNSGNTVVADFTWSWEGKKATINLKLMDANEVGSWFENQFNKIKESTIAQTVKAAQPIAGYEFKSEYLFMKGMSQTLAELFSTRLADELTHEGSKNRLPVTIAYNYGSPPSTKLPPGISAFDQLPYLTMTYGLPKGAQEMNL